MGSVLCAVGDRPRITATFSALIHSPGWSVGNLLTLVIVFVGPDGSRWFHIVSPSAGGYIYGLYVRVRTWLVCRYRLAL